MSKKKPILEPLHEGFVKKGGVNQPPKTPPPPPPRSQGVPVVRPQKQN